MMGKNSHMHLEIICTLHSQCCGHPSAVLRAHQASTPQEPTMLTCPCQSGIPTSLMAVALKHRQCQCFSVYAISEPAASFSPP